MTQQLHFQKALLPDGWACAVLVSIDDNGDIESVEIDAKPGEAAIISQPVVAGMINCHSHAHQRAIVGLTEVAGPKDDTFWTWRTMMYRYANALDPDDLQAISAQLYVECLKAGYTSVAEFQYLHHQRDGTLYDNRAEMTYRCLAAAQDAGIGFIALPVLYAFGGFGSVPPQDGQRRFINDRDGFVEIVAQLHRAIEDNPNYSLGIAPHSLRAIDRDLLQGVLTDVHLEMPQAPVHIHVAEQRREVEECLSQLGQRPIEWLLSHFDVDDRWCLIHATHLEDDEIATLATSDATVGLCPTTEANLGDGIFPADAYLKAGGTIAIGSDSQVTVCPAQELRLLEYGQRLVHEKLNILGSGCGHSTGRHLYDLACAGGARSTNRSCGAIAPGARADFITLDDHHPVLIGREGDAILDAWIFSAGQSAIKDVYVGGRKVVADGHHIDEEAIFERFQNTLLALTS